MNVPINMIWDLPYRSYTTLPLKFKMVFVGLLLIGTLSLFAGLWEINKKYMVEVITPGGQITEGILGFPQFINPLLADSRADHDMTSLIFSGLMRRDESGNLIPDLAESYEISEDGLEYTFTLREDLYWHDGTPLTAKDVAFTIECAQDPRTRSPRRANWEGVATKTNDDRTVTFTLDQPFGLFLENTTLGIIPRHIWRRVPPELFLFNEHNIAPVGSGPYQIKEVGRDTQGVIEYYNLKTFSDFALGSPNIKELKMNFYSNADQIFEAWDRDEIDNLSGISPQKLDYFRKRGAKLRSLPLPRLFAVFFNQNQADIFTDQNVRKALNHALDQTMIIERTLNGHGRKVTGPTLPEAQDQKTDPSKNPEINAEEELIDRITEARDILTNAGWEKNEDGIFVTERDGETLVLSFNLATAQTPELITAAEMATEAWQELGAEINLRVHEPNDLKHQIIRPRNYEAVLFGLMIGQDQDLYSYWHSSQRQDPGLNISMYTNITADNLLEKTRTETDPDKRLDLLEELTETIREDHPAAWLYAPNFIYLTSPDIKHLTLPPINQNHDRFATIFNWYTNTENVWRIFANEHNKVK